MLLTNTLYQWVIRVWRHRVPQNQFALKLHRPNTRAFAMRDTREATAKMWTSAMRHRALTRAATLLEVWLLYTFLFVSLLYLSLQKDNVVTINFWPFGFFYRLIIKFYDFFWKIIWKLFTAPKFNYSILNNF